ncbi:MAG: hypothetical protein Q4E55_00980 [Bacteroidales bacterium]|nr:hypothetical protein [Bacteroidales bacterium]
MKIVTHISQTRLAEALGESQSFVSRAMNFRADSLRAMKTRAKIILLYNGQIFKMVSRALCFQSHSDEAARIRALAEIKIQRNNSW